MNTKFEDRLLKALDVLENAKRLREIPVPVSPQGFRCCVYFIRCGEFVKIGIATSVRVRIKALQTSSPLELKAEGFIPLGSDEQGYRLERELHRRFNGYRVRGEWFRYCPEIAEYIAQHAQAEETRDAIPG